MRPSHGFPKRTLFIFLSVAAGACTNQIGPSHETGTAGSAGSANPVGAGGAGSPTGAGGKPVTTGVAGGAVNPSGIGGAIGTADACPSTARHADAAAPPDPLRVREHGARPAGRRSRAGQRPARRRGHRTVQQQRRRPDGVVAARREVRARLRGAGQGGRAEPGHAHDVRHQGQGRGRLRAAVREERSGVAPSGGPTTGADDERC